MTDTTHQKAIIYCRVSDVKQTIRGSGLSSQETRCREYAAFRKLQVVKVFKEDYTGATEDRPAMKDALAYLRKNRAEPHVFLIDDLSRLARDVVAFSSLRQKIAAAGGVLESPTMQFGEDSDSQFVQNVLASAAQLERQKNAERTKNRMRARAMNGFWQFYPPLGYTSVPNKAGGKIMIRREPEAAIVTEALEGFASGRFQTQAEVMRFLNAHPELMAKRRTAFNNQRVNDLLTQILYAGYIEVPRWQVSLRPAKHEPLITLATYEAIQDRLRGKAKVPVRKNVSEDFPLRGFVCCADCHQPMTANWSRGTHASYAYYLCRTKGCESEAKSIARDKVEGAFESMLRSLVPSTELMELASVMFRDLWEQLRDSLVRRRKSMLAELSQIELKVEQLLERVVQSESLPVIKAYERSIEQLERDKAVIREKVEQCGRPLPDYDATFRTTTEFLAKPWKLWESNRLEDKKAVLKLAFAERLRFHRETGFRTPETTLPFKVLDQFSGQKEEMARPERFERPTLRFVV